MPDPLHQHSDAEIVTAASMASLPVDVLADPAALDVDGSIRCSHRDAVRPERIRAGAAIVAGWGDHAWRTRLVADDGGLAVSAPDPDPAPVTTSAAAWHSHAHLVLEAHWAQGTDAATRQRVVTELLELPLRDLRRQSRSVRLLLGSHRSLRRAARRMLLQAVAHHHLNVPAAPHALPTWQVLARLTRTPVARLAGDTPRAVLVHDARPQCPTARRWSDG